MIVQNLITKKKYSAFILSGEEYYKKDYWHPMSPGMLEAEKFYVVFEWDNQCLFPRYANNYMLVEATPEEDNHLRDSGYQMIGLEGSDEDTNTNAAT